MKKISLAFFVLCLTAGLFAQPFDGGVNYPPANRHGNDQSSRRLRNNRQTEQKEEKPLDVRSPANRLELKSPAYRHNLQTPHVKEETKGAKSTDIKKPEAKSNPVLLLEPVSGPGNPLAKPTIEYAPMMPGKKIFECSHCHYIYYTTHMPDIVKCEKPGFNHDWHLIGLKGNIWYRCINCNTHVCCSKIPIRSHCTLESKHIWEIVGELDSSLQKKELEKELE